MIFSVLRPGASILWTIDQIRDLIRQMERSLRIRQREDELLGQYDSDEEWVEWDSDGSSDTTISVASTGGDYQPPRMWQRTDTGRRPVTRSITRRQTRPTHVDGRGITTTGWVTNRRRAPSPVRLPISYIDVDALQPDFFEDTIGIRGSNDDEASSSSALPPLAPWMNPIVRRRSP